MRIPLRLEPLDERALPATLPGNLLIYYGYPSLIDDQNPATSPAQTFGQYDMVVLGADIELPTHGDHANVEAILADAAVRATAFYGYVDLGVTTMNFSLSAIQQRLRWWADLGVQGVLLDDFGYDFHVPRARQNAAVDYAHGLGLRVIANGWDPDDLFSTSVDAVYNPDGLAPRLSTQDFYLLESYQIREGNYTDPELEWGPKAALIRAYQEQWGFQTIAVSTSTDALGYDPTKFNYAYLSAVTENLAAYGWGEPSFSSSDNLAPFRIRPTIPTTPVVLSGTQGNDTITITPLNGAGSDVEVIVNGNTVGTYAAATPFKLNVRDGNDTLIVGEQVGPNFISGKGIFGALTVTGGKGSKNLTGGYAPDTFTLGTGTTTINGTFGNDTVTVAGGLLTVNGGFGNDTVQANKASATVDGGPEYDSAFVTTGSLNLTAVENTNNLTNLYVHSPIVTEGNNAARPTGFLSTKGNQLVDQNKQPVKLASENWYGFETQGVVEGLTTRGYRQILDTIKSNGFNSLRLPFALQTFEQSAATIAGFIDPVKNPDLVGLTPLRVLDKIIDYAGALGLRVVLDCHRTQLGAGANPNGLWYDNLYTEQDWIDRWVALATRYRENPAVVGMDLFNEPHAVGATDGTAWDDGPGGRADWRLAAERAGNAILAVHPKLLIIVEGVGDSPGVTAFYGANLSEAKAKPIRLNIANRLVYSPHDYGQSVFDHTWFHDVNYPKNLYKVWNDRWGYLYWNNVAPIWLGEFGSTLDTAIDQQWYTELINYLGGDKNGDGRSDLRGKNLGMSWAHFAVNPSINPGGSLQPDWQTTIGKIVIPLNAIQMALPPATSNQVMTFQVTLGSGFNGPVTVRYRTVNGTAIAGKDYVATAGTLTFAPGETRRVVTVPLLGDTVAESRETMKLLLFAPKNARLTTATALGTIIDDDAAIKPIQVANVVQTTDQVSFDIVLTNTTLDVLAGWQLALTAPFNLESVAGANVVQRARNDYVLQAAATNPYLLPYETQTIHIVAMPGTRIVDWLETLVWSYEFAI